MPNKRELIHFRISLLNYITISENIIIDKSDIITELRIPLNLLQQLDNFIENCFAMPAHCSKHLSKDALAAIFLMLANYMICWSVFNLAKYSAYKDEYDLGGDKTWFASFVIRHGL